jgi:hypothetical protein
MPELRRRDLIALLGGAAAAWPLGARAQQEGVRRIGVLTADAEDVAEVRARLAALREGLERLGWSEGRTVRIDYRFAAKIRIGIGRSPKSWSVYNPMCSSHIRHRSPWHFSGRLARSRSYSSVSPIRSAQVWSRAWRGRAVISRACCCTRKASQANGWQCLRRLPRACPVPRSSPIPGGPHTITLCDRPSR